MSPATDISNISGAHERQVQEAAPYQGMGATNWQLRQVLYFLAEEAERLADAGLEASAALVEEIFQGALEVVKP